ncbi:ATP-binding protein [Mycobacterium sp.]|uniref:ATP-binding protein n=1 Tax=Mycobacterium sp. TaxID=1785 RepID=UPI002D369335|nr:adenylate/guanylate cyclase domain-containing protein [Mycobacterium sp.]HZA09782.1 adenylate/guanylate cyclase domain-containing protein [Mycobacterium sp.]
MGAVGERKQVTVLFGDVVGSMRLAAALDPERLREIMYELFNKSAAIVQRYRGTVDKFTGDGLMALFGAPVALEDHAMRACITALEIQAAAEKLAAEVRRRDNVELKVRVGLNSGEVVAGEIGRGPGRYTAVGHSVGMAQRMEAAAPPGTVLCSESTARLVEGRAQLGPTNSVAVKGETRLIPARRLLSVPVQETVVGRDAGPMLGRDAELQEIMRVFDSGDASVIGVVGEPGIGKSRLIREFAARVRRKEADVVVARCDAHTADVPLWALSRMLRAMFGVSRLDDPAARAQVLERLPITAHSDGARVLFDLLGITEPGSAPVELSLDARHRRLVDAMIKATEFRSRRAVFILEDAHWIDAASEATLSEFAASLSALQSTLVTTYRPEYRGPLRDQPDTTITLSPLTDDTAVAMAEGLIGHDPTVGGIADLIARSAAGNPFFVEEMVRDLADRGVLAGSRGCYRRQGDVDPSTVPATVHTVVAARIDRLPPQAKWILNAAAVIGSSFDVDRVQTLLPNTDRDDLADLVSMELIDQIEFLPRARYCFRHPLIRKVAYESQLTATRAGAHRRLASALQTLHPPAVDDNAALIATHLEAAGDLKPAYDWHMRAANWLKTRDMVAARTSWERARRIADRLPSEQPGSMALRAAPRTMLVWTDWLVGADPDADTCYDELRALTEQSGDTLSLAIGMAGRVTAWCENYSRPVAAAALAAELAGMIDDVRADPMSKADLLFAVTWAQFVVCDFEAVLRNADRIRLIAGSAVTGSIARANAVCGVSRILRGDVRSGRRELAIAIEQARQLDPVTHAAVMTLKCGLAAIGLEIPEDTTLQDAREALNRAEEFGDRFALACALWACGTLLLRMERHSVATAVDYLERARSIITKHRTVTIALAPIEADLAIAAARAGDRDVAIDSVRAALIRQYENFDFMFLGVTTTALVQLLVDRSGADDIAEATAWAQRLEGQASQLTLPTFELSAAFCRIVITRSGGDAALSTAQYLDIAQRLDARGKFLVLHPVATT